MYGLFFDLWYVAKKATTDIVVAFSIGVFLF